MSVQANLVLVDYKGLVISLRLYEQGWNQWWRCGYRKLGPRRYALDAGRVALILEKYNHY